MRTLKILVLIASATFTIPASAELLHHDDGVTYEDIAKCLREIGLEHNVHFRKKPGTEGIIQLNRAAVQSDFRGFRTQIDGCWRKHPTADSSSEDHRPQGAEDSADGQDTE